MNLSVTEVTSSNSLISQIMIMLMFLMLFKLLELLFDSSTWFFVVVVFWVFFLHQKTSLRYSVVSLKNEYLPRQRSRCSNGNFNQSEWYHKFVSRWYLKAKRFGDAWCCHIRVIQSAASEPKLLLAQSELCEDVMLVALGPWALPALVRVAGQWERVFCVIRQLANQMKCSD